MKTELDSEMKEDEIQENEKLKKKLSEYKTFCNYPISNVFDGAKDLQGLRVVEKPSPEKSIKEEDRVGTVYDLIDGDVVVRWDKLEDNLDTICVKDSHNQFKLLLLNNEQKGVLHADIQCNGCTKYPLRGIRWKCLTCDDYDLCTKCYMNNVHYLHHIFRRILSTNLKGKQMPPRSEKLDVNRSSWKTRTTRKTLKNPQQRMANGIIKGSEVNLRLHLGIKGKVIDVCYNTNTEKDKDCNTVKVMWNPKFWEIHTITELLLISDSTFTYYPDHLPVLGQYADGYFEANDDNAEKAAKKITVFIWRQLREKAEKTEPSFKPSLYLIINTPQENKAVCNSALMEEILKFAQSTKLPCHVVGERVLFHSGSTESVCIHYKTRIDTIKELKKKGFYKFERGDEEAKDEIEYFRRIAEYAIGEEVLPVIISLQNGSMKQADQQKYKYPIIGFKKNTQDVNVLWPIQTGEKCVGGYVEYRTDTKKPWRVKISDTSNQHTNHCEDDIELLSDIGVVDLNTLIGDLIVGVSFEEAASTKTVDPKKSINGIYPTALSINLLKRGDWKISKQYMKKPFDQKSLEYVYEKVITSEFIENVWSSQKSFSAMRYQVPKYQAKSDNKQKTESSTDTLDHRIEFTNWNSECNGLIFLALLHKKYWSGAKQLVETGYVGIHHILVGCVLLNDELNNWKTTTALKEKLQLLQSAFTERAIGITSCIYEADKIADDKIINKSNIDSTEKFTEDTELDDNINHAGRLLLNHGYLREAINTENNTFLKNDAVRKVLNKQWYGTEEVDSQTIFRFIFLVAAHLILLPLLMINMEARPLRRFYKQYKLPFLKVVIHMLGFLVLLIAYAYMLLFDYGDKGLTSSDYFIIVFISSFVVDEIKQVIVAFLRGQLKSYASDWWNTLDWLFNISYTLGMLLRAGYGSGFQNTSKCLLLLAFMILCVRILNICCMTEFLGPKLIIIRKMIKQTVAFMIIMTVIVVWYSVSFHALVYPNSEFSWREIEKIMSNGYWMLFGELDLNDEKVTVQNCTNTINGTADDNYSLQQSAIQLGEDLTPYLKALYGLIAVVLLLNLLIALYSDTFNLVQQQSEFYWRQIQTDFLEEYSIKTIFPMHLQLLAFPGIITAIILVCYSNLRGKLSNKYNMHEGKAKLNHRPMLVRVFLYDTNYDLKLKSTEDAEEKGALDNKGKIDLEDFDAIATMNKIADSLKDLKEKKQMRELDSKRADRRNHELLERQQNMEIMLKEIMKKLDIETRKKDG